MPLRHLACAAILATGCLPADDDPPFRDRGLGVWTEVEGVPPIAYLALWGSSATDVLAAGAGGVAHFDGQVWRTLDGIPATTYRAAWGRSPGEVWLGGDNTMLARSLTGWQAQRLFDGELEITEYSVIALPGDESTEYAIVATGGKRLLLRNRGSAWETVSIAATLPLEPSMIVRSAWITIAGGDDLLVSSGGWPRSFEHRKGPPVTALGNGDDFWIAAGAGDALIHRAGDHEPWIALRTVPMRAVRAVLASRKNRFFLAGDPATGGPAIQSCDDRGCAGERVEVFDGADDVELAPPLRAIWGDGAGLELAAGDALIVQRRR